MLPLNQPPDNLQDTRQLLVWISDCLEQAGLFFGHGTDNAWDEACWLVAGVLRQDARPGQAAPLLDEKTILSEAQWQRVKALLAARIESRKPLAYLLGEAWFAGLCFEVDESVLVPRSPLAELILGAFSPLLQAPPRRILDLCTGSGCIGIACAKVFPEAQVVLADISPEALAVARRNVAAHRLESRVQVVESDLFQALAGRFDLIVTNPPYVSQEEYEHLPEEYLREPALGLVSEDSGMAIPQAILSQSPDFLTPEGWLVMEVGHGWPELEARCEHLPLLWLAFESGGEGVCAIQAPDLIRVEPGGPGRKLS